LRRPDERPNQRSAAPHRPRLSFRLDEVSRLKDTEVKSGQLPWGAKGDTGAAGLQGPKGDTGATGAQGEAKRSP